MPPYRNPVEARRKKERPVQKVADQNCYMSSADFNEKYHGTNQRDDVSRAGKADHGADRPAGSRRRGGAG